MNSIAGTDNGFTLVEMVCVVALVALLAAVLLPAFPRNTSRPRLEAYAVEAAAVLKADRVQAMRRHVQVATQIDAERRTVRSNFSGRMMKCRMTSFFAPHCPNSAMDDRHFLPSVSLQTAHPAEALSRWRDLASATRFG